ncbi:SLC13 family permease [Bythopirellula goksoeyrii]|uniref:Sodium-dependent dicarboxylate transporter SdcS n=1 Tax=Bythopirellula goksoeyrii TaxID=1400387 RepID=A0A5B9QFL6_9BACT|nr:SLC13 family permease [Bythopirellula goksoeyrii]QEG33121.1 Sodium-dependent dicarboxylate transporter SdcS [Bythopirellula goksoeyrii]
MKQWALWLGPVVAVLLGYLLYWQGLPSAAAWTAGITALTALWWVLEPIPIPATSLIPLAMFPLVGVLTADEVGAAYGNPMILLLTGGFMLSSAMERSGTHRRIALGMVSILGGTNGRRLVLGFMLASAFLSMWISNAATTLMLLPIVVAVIEKVSDERLSLALLLGYAYAASVGGIGTPIGTPPNLIFMQNYESLVGEEISFLTWMSWTLPIVLIMIPLIWLWLTRRIESTTRIELPPVGEWRKEEIRTLAVFATTALLWITRSDPFGGWRELLNLPGANDASIALLAVVALFLIPNGKGEQLLDWETAVKIPWGVLLLFSSGIVIAQAFIQSGLSQEIGDQLASLSTLPVPLLIGFLCLTITFMTEVTSNTAIASLMMPILAATATATDIDPKLLMVPAALTASFAFMLPVATAPNAVVFSSGRVTVRQMAREGFVLNLMGVVVVTIYSSLVFG